MNQVIEGNQRYIALGHEIDGEIKESDEDNQNIDET